MSPSDKPFDDERYKALMDGHAIKEKSLSKIMRNKDSRVDSQFWTTEIVKNDNYSYYKIGDLIKGSQYGISVDMNMDGKGYPIFRMNELHDMLMDLSTEKCADISPVEYQNFSLNDGDVLFNRTNSYEWVGRTAVYYKNNNTPFTYASYLVKFVTDRSKLLPECLTAFLSCKYGITAIKARARQSINQTNVNPEEVKEIEMPLFSRAFQEVLRDLFVRANANRIEADIVYNQANTILDNSINSVNVSSAAISVKLLSNSFLQSGRLDAEYYQPKYDTLFKVLSNFHCEKLGGKDGLVTIMKSIEPGSDAYQEEGIPFVRVSDLDKFGIVEPTIKLPANIVSNVGSLFPKKDTILLSKDGSVGLAYKVEEPLQVITSGALLHLTIKDTGKILPDYLTLVLNSPIVQLQAERDVNSAVIPHWKPAEIENVLIPILDMEIQKEISDKVLESFALRHESKRLLNFAVKAVEMAIETDEESALLWLELQN